MTKIIKTGKELREKLLSGVEKAGELVKTTLGPAGHDVLLTNTMAGPEISRDGASVIKNFEVSDQIENSAIQVVKEASLRTEKEAGDGTSSSAVLTEELYKKGLKAVESGANVNEVKLGMEKAREWIKNYVSSCTTKVDGNLDLIKKVATISANNDPSVGDLIIEGMKKVGTDGLITAEEGSGLDTEIEVTTGMRLDKGWSSPLYVTDPKTGTCTMDNPYILVVNEKISSVNQLYEVLKAVTDPNQGGSNPLLIIADDIDSNVNAMLVYNVQTGALRACVVKSPDFGDSRVNTLADIAVATGATFFTEANGNLDALGKAGLMDLGRCGKVVITRDNTTIYDFKGDSQAISDRSSILRARLENPETTDYDKKKFEKRLANLSGGIAMIKVGGSSDAEKNNRMETITDAILASKLAISGGVVPGAGSVFYRASLDIMKDHKFWKSLKGDEKEGAEIVISGIPVIFKTVVQNSGVSMPDSIIAKAKSWKPGIGYNAKTRKPGVNLVESGILDPAGVLVSSLNNSIAAASMLLSIGKAVVDDNEEEKKDK